MHASLSDAPPSVQVPEPPTSEVRLRVAAPAISAEEALAQCRRVVTSLAARFAHFLGFSSFDDLVQEGSLAVLDAATRWCPDLDSPLPAFAYARVRGRMLRFLSYERRRGLVTARGQLGDRDGITNASTISVDAPLDDDNRRSLHDVMGAPASQEDELGDAEERARIDRAAEELSERDQRVLALVRAGATCEDVGREIGLAASRCAPLIHEVYARLRAVLEGRAPAATNKVGRIEHDGQSLTIAGWARVSGIPYFTLRQRINGGWSIEEALATPVDTRHGRRRGADR
jgi:RNA polymerase sigma factor (sigma-70 family)